MSDLADACAELAQWLPAARALITAPDQQRAATRTQPGSAPPWNAAAAAAYYDAHAAVRDLEQELRQVVTGRPAHHTPRRAGWSDGNTLAALDAIGKLGEASPGLAGRGARQIEAHVTVIMQLPAVDLAERARRVRTSCPYCARPMLRLLPRSGLVTCLAYGSCSDADGRHPSGKLGLSVLTGDPVIRWADGLVT